MSKCRQIVETFETGLYRLWEIPWPNGSSLKFGSCIPRGVVGDSVEDRKADDWNVCSRQRMCQIVYQIVLFQNKLRPVPSRDSRPLAATFVLMSSNNFLYFLDFRYALPACYTPRDLPWSSLKQLWDLQRAQSHAFYVIMGVFLVIVFLWIVQFPALILFQASDSPGRVLEKGTVYLNQ